MRQGGRRLNVTGDFHLAMALAPTPQYLSASVTTRSVTA